MKFPVPVQRLTRPIQPARPLWRACARVLQRLAAMIALLWHGLATAHISSTGLATLDAAGTALHYKLTLSPAELGERGAELVRAAGGDSAAAAQWGASLQAHLSIEVDGKPCRIRRLRLQAAGAGEERVQVLLDWACPSPPSRLVMVDRLPAWFGEHHRNIVSISLREGQRSEHVLTVEQPRLEAVAQDAAPSGWWDFIKLGCSHILEGADHLLFLAALLMGTRGMRSLLITATAFTLAHSASLALAVLQAVQVPVAVVEPAIAASIIWVALENLWWPVAGWRRHGLAFAFGLVHGLAFAEALTELHLQGLALVRALLGFNVGVEIGQALVIALLAPLLAWAARYPRWRRGEQFASVVIAALGATWLVQRLLP